MTQSIPVSPILAVTGADGVDLTKPVAYTRGFLRAIDPDVDPAKVVAGTWRFDYGPVGYVPGTKIVAFGFFRPANHLLEIRHDMDRPDAKPKPARDLRKGETQYTCAHEWLGHGWDWTMADNQDREDILKAMKLGATIDKLEQELGDRDKAIIQTWNRGPIPKGKPVPYWERPYEAAADMTVSALTALSSLFEAKYVWDIDADLLKQIILRDNTPEPPDPPVPPDPPEPPTPPQTVDVPVGTALVVRAV